MDETKPTTCANCGDSGTEMVTVGGPDEFGNYDATEIPCRDCDISSDPEDEASL